MRHRPDGEIGLGALILVGGALAWSVGTVTAARGIRGRGEPIAIAGWQMTVGGVVLLAWAALAESLDVSKTPIREALATLVHEVFVEVLPRQGYRVTDLTLTDVQEIFNLRLLLEPAAAAMASLTPRASPHGMRPSGSVDTSRAGLLRAVMHAPSH